MLQKFRNLRSQQQVKKLMFDYLDLYFRIILSQTNMSHLTSKFKSTPTFTFKTKNSTITSANLPQCIPSPQHYEVHQFDISSKTNKGIKFSLQKKGLSLNTSKDIPGPGTYESNLSINLGSFNKTEILKKGEKRFRQANVMTPSPNNYHIISSSKKSLPQFSIGKMNRSSQQINGRLEGPAPNNYNPIFSSQEQSIIASIGNSQRKININNAKIPGPGAYQIQKQFVSNSFNQNKSLLPKAQRFHSSRSVYQIPGPASYQQKSLFIQNQRKHRGFTWKNRSQPHLISTPGPGSYNNDSQRFKFKSGSGIILPRSQRRFLNSETKRSTLVPGPGQHQSSYHQFSKMKSFSVSATKFPKTALPHFVQSKERQLNFINPQKLDVCKTSVPKYTLSHSKRRDTFDQQLKRKTPSKFYDYNFKVVSKSQIAFKLSKSNRMKNEQLSNLGPGVYQVQTNFLPDKKIKFSKQKRRTFLDDVIKTKITTFKGDTYQARQQFPNPPKYMNVYKKLQINETKIKKH